MDKLKVFRTAIGFHDAYVAAPSRAAALRAWGTDTDLFSAGLAELVIDHKLTAAPLETPGEVVKVSRGSRAKKMGKRPAIVSRKAAIAKPSRRKVDEAETALEEANKTHRKALEKIDRRIAKLGAERAALGDKARPQRKTLERRVADAQQAYTEALEKWRKSG